MKHLFTGLNHIIHAIVKAINDKFRSVAVDKNDVCFMGCGVFVILGYFNPWFLCFAFIALLPALNDQLNKKNKKTEVDSSSKQSKNNSSTSSHNVVQTNVSLSTTESTTSDSNSTEVKVESTNDDTPPQNSSSSQPTSLPSAPTDSNALPQRSNKEDSRKTTTTERCARDEWGLPTVHITGESGKTIEVNANQAVPIESKYFKGVILPMIRCDGEYEKYNRYGGYFGNKQRRFEVQFQGTMLTIPEGVVMLGGELEEKVSLGYVTRALMSILIKFCMNLNKYLDVNLGEDPKDNGKYEVPHLTFPLFRVMDRVVVTPPGETPPQLGQELPEPDADRNLRRSGKSGEMQFQPNFIYSFSFHSMYVDFQTWSLCNFPGYKAIDLKTFLGNQKIKIVVYELKKPDDYDPAQKIPHHVCSKRYLTTMQMSHISIMTPEEIAAADATSVVTLPLSTVEDGDETGAPDIPIGEVDTHYTAADNFWVSPSSASGDVTDEGQNYSAACSDDDGASESHSEADGNGQATEFVDAADMQLSDEDEKSNLVHVSVAVSLVCLETVIDESVKDASEDSAATAEVNVEDRDSEVEDAQVFTPLEAQDPPDVQIVPATNGQYKYLGIADIGGFAFRQEQNTPTLVRFIRLENPTSAATSRLPLTSLRRLSMRRAPLEKTPAVGGEEVDATVTEESIPSRRDYLCSGDTVLIQNVKSGAYMTIFRGWWVGFTNDIAFSRAKGCFSVVVLDPTTMQPVSKGTPITVGTPFRLRSVKWPMWELGHYVYNRMGRGGLSLVLYQISKNLASPSRPVRWTKNGRLIQSLQLSVITNPVISHVDESRSVTNKAENNKDPSLSKSKRPLNSIVDNYFSSDQDTANNEDSTSSETSLQAFPVMDSIIDIRQLPLSINVNGWIEMMNRTTNRTLFCYIVVVSIGTGEKKQWTTLRSQEDIDTLFQDLPEDILRDGLDEYQPCASDRDTVPAVSQTLVQKLTMRKRWTKLDFQEQYSNDQKVQIINHRIQRVLERISESLVQKDKIESNKLSIASNDEVKGTNDTDNNKGLKGDEINNAKLGTSPPRESSMLSVSPPRNISVKAISVTPIEREQSPVPVIVDQNCAIDTKNTLLKTFGVPNLLDSWFLTGSPEKNIRFAPSRKQQSPQRPQVAFVARAMWESHWREEIMVLYPSHVSFHNPGSSKSHWNLPLQDITGISNLPVELSPMPGFSILRLETIGRVHYIAFCSKSGHDNMTSTILEYFSELTFDMGMPAADLGDPRDRFVLKSGRWQTSGTRLILNARKFSFDCESLNNDDKGPKKTSYLDLSVSLLQGVFDLDPAIQSKSSEVVNFSTSNISSSGNDLFPGREKIISFLDETVALKKIDLQHDIDLSSREALCFFVNIYHTLIVHARLVLGPPSYQNWPYFFDSVCYEIGNEVFSITELEHCVIRGKLTRPHAVPRNFPHIPPYSDARHAYALTLSDQRINFLLNCGSTSNPAKIYLLRPDNLYMRLNDSSVDLFNRSLQVDMKRNVVILPKVCDLYKEDFGNDTHEVLRHILRYLGREQWENVSLLLTSPKLPTVKFHDYKFVSHEHLELVST